MASMKYFLSVVLQISGSVDLLKTKNNVELHQVVSHSDTFARQFYSARGAEVEGNFVSSPIGALIALSMLAYGANKNLPNRLERDLLFCTNKSLQNHGMRALVNILHLPERSQMSSIIFADGGMVINLGFQLAMVGIFQTEIKTVNYSDPQEAINTINTWWHKKAESDAYNIISPDDVSNRTILVLANVIEINSYWATTFNKTENQLHSVYDDNGRVHHYQSMHTSQILKYRLFRDVGVVFVEIPYEEADLSLVLIMSKNASETTILDHHFNLDVLFNMSRNGSVDFDLPKFRIESTIDLTNFLRSAGIRGGLDSFTRITSHPLKFSSIKQKTYIEIDEERTRAMAVTIITNDESKSKKPEAPEAPVHFKAEVPFYFAIVKHLNSQDYVVLFNGHYKNVN
ncbi:serpin B4-like [Fopius arisanus]|uniref:Serpin B4-like n=1 Tax=Fopius arisanus TaxID=64838 RepID=A0A9R1TTX1_9HYME|nr:PREDICTED: serpin B4-like [Fopius arisanus]